MNWKKTSTRKSAAIIVLGLFFIGAIVLKVTSTKKVESLIKAEYFVSDPAFRNSMSGLLGTPFLDGNSAQELLNGDQIFPAMLAAIAAATNSITFENYIWETGEVGHQFEEALIDRARAGVKVHSIVDGMGTLKLEDEDIDRMKAAGIKFIKLGRDHWYKLKLSINHRTHRKILVVDGKVGFIGGVCIADKWQGNGEVEDHWRDTHFRVEGPVVRQMQGIFSENWLQTTSKVLEGGRYFPEIETAGDVSIQAFKSGPKDGEENARLVHLMAIAAARKNIRLSHAYFVPDDLAIKELLAARKRGVKVEIIVPFKNDSAIGRAASRSRWGDLLEAGVEFYQYKAALFHCKVMIVDDIFVTAGSINFDNRSFRINDEANINVLDKKFASAQVKVFEEDKKRSAPLTVEMLAGRPWYIKCGDHCAGYLRSQL